MVSLQIISPVFPDSFSASLLTALISRSLFMPPISLPSFSINLSLPLPHKQREKAPTGSGARRNGPFISPQNSGNPARSHLRLRSASLGRMNAARPASCRAATTTKRPSGGGLGSISWSRLVGCLLASRRNERSRCVLPRDPLLRWRRTPAECEARRGFVHRRRFGHMTRDSSRN